jgi:uncharacterized protein (TIGR02145 family)
MKFITKLFLLVLLVCTSFQAFGQNQIPIVQNVTFSQRTDGTFKVDIYYSVNNPEGTSMIISMKVSGNNGTTWDLSCPSLTGDVGPWITNGTTKHIVWDFAADHPNIFNDQIRIKILADDGGLPCPGMPTFTDSRNGKIYNTIQVASQCWLRENIDIGTMIPGTQEQTSGNGIEKYCYGDIEANCTTYGGLYQWNEAMQYVTTPGATGICPTGWHIPTLEQLQVLSVAVGGDGYALQSLWQGTTVGNGTNTSGLSALLAGTRYYDGTFYGLGYYPYFWSSTEDGATNAVFLYLYDNVSNVDLNNTYKEFGFSVRCVKD